jgi:hypothetical protein
MILAQIALAALGPDETKMLGAMVTIILACALGAKLLMPIAQGFGRRLAGKEPDRAMQQELDELRGRVAALEATEARLVELEERQDFTERLLTRSLPQVLEHSDTPPESFPAPR